MRENYYSDNGLIAAFRRYRNALHALILRDVKSRFMGSLWGYIVSILWPLSHIGLLLVIHSAFDRIQPYGDSAAVWYSTGIVPFMAFSYTLRFITLGLMQNAPLLGFPAIKILDIVIARILVEILSVGIVFFIVSIILSIIGHSFIPFDIATAFVAILLAFLTGVSIGIFFATLSRISPMWNFASVILVISLWVTSGVFFVPFFLPDRIVRLLYLLPTVQFITIFRSSYFDGYGAEFISIRYVAILCLCMFAISLTMERLLRGRLLRI